MEIEKKYFTSKQIELIKNMKKGVWYSPYDIAREFDIENTNRSLLGLFRNRVVDLEEDTTTRKFFSYNIHRKFKIKDNFKLVKNIPPNRKI